MNWRSEVYRCNRMLVATALVLCAVALALPGATVCAMGTERTAAWQGGDGYGTAWFVDPGEWYAAPAEVVARASNPRPADDGYGTAWFVDPGEWHVAPESRIFLVGRPESSGQEEPSAWFVDPGEWHVAPGGPLAQGNQGDSGTD